MGYCEIKDFLIEVSQSRQRPKENNPRMQVLHGAILMPLLVERMFLIGAFETLLRMPTIKVAAAPLAKGWRSPPGPMLPQRRCFHSPSPCQTFHGWLRKAEKVPRYDEVDRDFAAPGAVFGVKVHCRVEGCVPTTYEVAGGPREECLDHA